MVPCTSVPIGPLFGKKFTEFNIPCINYIAALNLGLIRTFVNRGHKEN